VSAGGFGPVSDPDGRMLDQIRLTGLTARGTHGVFEHERRDGQDFVIDVVLHLDTGKAAATDDLAATADYGVLAGLVADVVRGEPVDLIETLADRIATACLDALQIAAVQVVDVAVHKPQAPITEVFGDVVVAIRRHRTSVPASSGDALDRHPGSAVPVVLALGTNLGDRVATLRAAVRELRAAPGLTLTAVSPVVETDPVGGPEQPDYLNAVVVAETSLSPREVLALAHRIEAGAGRQRAVRWGPRTLDVDVIRYSTLTSDDPELTLPHPRAHERAFVLAPWLAADPDAELPVPGGRRAIAELLAEAGDADGVRPRPDLVIDDSDGADDADGGAGNEERTS
jgi:dihydroneopterin aldolase/2-amino-4-hydroxy-6-hydroxymethyldihydropteridine diphosphokinase